MAMSTSRVRENYGGLSLPPADHSRSILSHLAQTGGAAQAAPSFRILGSDRDEVCGHCPEHLAVAAKGLVCSQGSESNNRWCLVTIALLCSTLEVLRAAGGAC